MNFIKGYFLKKFFRGPKKRFSQGGVVPGPTKIESVALLPGEKFLIKDGEVIILLPGEEFMYKRKEPMKKDENETGSKYLKRIVLKGNCTADKMEGETVYTGIVDVYAVIEAFGVTCPARAHAIKKMLCPGERGDKDTFQDIKESKDAMIRAHQMEVGRKVVLGKALDEKYKDFEHSSVDGDGNRSVDFTIGNDKSRKEKHDTQRKCD